MNRGSDATYVYCICCDIDDSTLAVKLFICHDAADYVIGWSGDCRGGGICIGVSFTVGDGEGDGVGSGASVLCCWEDVCHGFSAGCCSIAEIPVEGVGWVPVFCAS